MAAAVQLEFDVQFTSDVCGQAVKSALERGADVESVTVDVQKKSVLVRTDLPSYIVQQRIEQTGRRAVLKGIGPASDSKQHFGAAVSALSGPNNIFGVVRFLQIDEQTCVIDGTVDGLNPGHHGLHVYEFGDISKGCSSLGDHYNPTNSIHGGPSDTNKHAGDLGSVIADENGRATFRMQIEGALKVSDIIGRSLGITDGRDDLGLGNNKTSKIDGNSGEGIACGIIARSAGLFQNPKRICSCSGRTIWEEREEAIINAKKTN